MNEIIAIALILSLVQVAKGLGLPTKLAPVLAIVLGLALALGFNGILRDNIIAGLIWGLSASGLWSGTKSTVAGIKGTSE